MTYIEIMKNENSTTDKLKKVYVMCSETFNMKTQE